MPVDPTPAQLADVAELARGDAGGALVMLNLNRYRERAAYTGDPPGGEAVDVSGREAYERYGATALAVLARLGGEILWHVPATMTVVGDPDDAWDDVIAVRYPSAQAFIELAFDPEIGAALAHRTAGLERALILRCDAPATA